MLKCKIIAFYWITAFLTLGIFARCKFAPDIFNLITECKKINKKVFAWGENASVWKCLVPFYLYFWKHMVQNRPFHYAACCPNAANDIIEKVLKHIVIPKILLIYCPGAKLRGPYRYSSAEVGTNLNLVSLLIRPSGLIQIFKRFLITMHDYQKLIYYNY